MNPRASSFITSVYSNLMSGDSDDAVAETLGTQDLRIPSFSEEILFELCEAAIEFCKERKDNKTLLRIEGQTIIVGDLHGNLHDLLRIWNSTPNIFNYNIIFLGDYVDRGQFQLETITLLLALKVEYPDNVFLLRGNHEFASVNSLGGFKNEIVKLAGYSEKLWEKFNEVFEWIPIAAIVNSSIFCVHGGLSQLLKSVSQIEENFQLPIKEFVDDQLLTDLMWSDPTNDCESFMASNRGTGVYFGFLATFQFLQKNDLKMVVRAHESINGGVRMTHDSKCITVFSSSGYVKGNLAGYIQFDEMNHRKSFRMKPIQKVNRADAKFYTPIPKPKPGLALHNMLSDQLLFTSKTVMLNPSVSSLIKQRNSRIVRPIVQGNIGLNIRRKSYNIVTNITPKISNSASLFL